MNQTAPTAGNIWTHEAKEEIARLLKLGLSASKIAAHFPGKSRNAIIGVVSRDIVLKQIGFANPGNPNSGRPKGSKTRCIPKPFSLRNRRANPQEAVTLPSLPEAPIWRGEAHRVGKPMWMLSTNQCRYPVNDAQPGETHLFCGGEADGSWCSFHRRLVYRRSRDLNEFGIAA